LPTKSAWKWCAGPVDGGRSPSAGSGIGSPSMARVAATMDKLILLRL